MNRNEHRRREQSQPKPAPAPIVSPAAKKLAEENGVDLSLIQGTGANGNIKKSDVEAFLSAQEEE
jgi:pyruvate dehydrogenase E2 component (dihydrolipoamide acetyltransferase)